MERTRISIKFLTEITQRNTFFFNFIYRGLLKLKLEVLKVWPQQQPVVAYSRQPFQDLVLNTEHVNSTRLAAWAIVPQVSKDRLVVLRIIDKAELWRNYTSWDRCRINGVFYFFHWNRKRSCKKYFLSVTLQLYCFVSVLLRTT